MRTNNPLADTFISHGMIIQEISPTQVSLTIGLRLTGISFDNASITQCHNIESSWDSFTKTLSPDFSVKNRYSKCGSFEKELRGYYDDTMSKANEFSQSQRNAKVCQLHDAIEARTLFRSESHLFLTRDLHDTGKRASPSSAAELEALFQAEFRSFHPVVEQAQSAARQSGGHCDLLDDAQLFCEIDKVLNPSLVEADDKKTALDRFDPAGSVSDCSLQSDMIASGEADCGFFFDGIYHSIILLRALPSLTTSGQILQLTNLPLKELAITTITRPLDLEKEIFEEERRAQKLRRAVASSNKLRLHTSLGRSEERIAQLASGEASPCSFQMILHLWDEDLATLQQMKIPTVKSAITRFQGAKYYVVENPVLARDAFLSTLPGIQTK